MRLTGRRIGWACEGRAMRPQGRRPALRKGDDPSAPAGAMLSHPSIQRRPQRLAKSRRRWRPPHSKPPPAAAAPTYDRFRPAPRRANALRARAATSAPARGRWLPDGSASETPVPGRRGSRRPAGHGATPPVHGPNWSAGHAGFARDRASVHRANAHRHPVPPPDARRRQPPGRAVAPGRSAPTRDPIPRGQGRHRGAARRQPDRAAAWRPRVVDQPTGAHR